jgi:hypothetical protein
MKPLTATFVEVPISVHVPPSIEAKASGINNLDGLILAVFATPITGGIKIAVAVVLFINEEMALIITITANRRRFLLR